MAKPVTLKALENRKPGRTRREVPDGLRPGLYFILRPTGKASWACRYRHEWQSRKPTLGPSPAIDLKRARGRARAALAKIAEGDDPASEKQAARRASRVPDDHDLIAKIVHAIRRAICAAESARGDCL